MRKKMPPRPYYGELESGETLPAQKPKSTPVKAKAKVKPAKKPGFGKKVGGGTVNVITKRKQALQEALGATEGRAAKHEKDMYGK